MIEQKYLVAGSLALLVLQVIIVGVMITPSVGIG